MLPSEPEDGAAYLGSVRGKFLDKYLDQKGLSLDEFTRSDPLKRAFLADAKVKAEMRSVRNKF